MLLTVALAFEYETACTRAEHLHAAQATEGDIHRFIDAIIDVAELVDVHYQWRPQVSDPADELILEAAVNGRADAIVTFNLRDYGTSPARFGIELLTPIDVLRRIRT